MSICIYIELMGFDIKLSKQKGDIYEMKIKYPQNSVGIIYRIAIPTFQENWNIISADGILTEANEVVGCLFIKNEKPVTVPNLKSLEKKIKAGVEKNLSVSEFMSENQHDLALVYKNKKLGKKHAIYICDDKSSGYHKLRIKTLDRSGFLMEVCQVLDLLNIDIAALNVRTNKNLVDDSFLIRREDGKALDDNMLQKIKKQIHKLL